MLYAQWLHYFQFNADHFHQIKWATPDLLTPREQKLIRSSIQQFQKGENSEGKNLWRNAIRYSKINNDNSYARTIELFIKEEQMHARVLGTFMKRHNIPKITSHWMDSVFRRLRNLAGLELSVIVLTTAEIISTVYYKALYAVTNSSLLKEICEQILKDEEMHVNFQAFTIRDFNYKRHYLLKNFITLAHYTLLFGTTVFVYIWHGNVLRAGGYNFNKFMKEVFKEMDRVASMVNNKKPIVIENPVVLFDEMSTQS
ncbi:MAG: hypothetical protein IIA45_01740 [Bacteroidetes bacterium]|nr:hypothetical protein [Bacteroidota bacterium]